LNDNDRRWSWVAPVALIISALSVLGFCLIAALGIRDREARDEQVDALRDRAIMAEDHRDCLLRAVFATSTTTKTVERAGMELVIQLAEQVDLYLKGAELAPDPIRLQILNARDALDALDLSLALLPTACPPPESHDD
jgi:hypothetical protein